MAAKKPPPKQAYTFEITLIRERGKLLGRVEAPDADPPGLRIVPKHPGGASPVPEADLLAEIEPGD